jgi:hypothetical protein
LIQYYDKTAIEHWCRTWERSDSVVNWIGRELVYHEACAVVFNESEIRIWDPTSEWWVNPKQLGGYGGVRALRIITPPGHRSLTKLLWHTYHIEPNQWQRLESADDCSSLPSALAKRVTI